jgi:uncharacterized protein
MYCTGTSVVRNLEEAVKWYRRSAEQGDRYAQYNLAVMLLKVRGTPPEEEEAFRWCRAAAEQGLPEAPLQLGDQYRAGNGVEEDQALARTWYEKAAAQGNADAAARLDKSPAARSGEFSGGLRSSDRRCECVNNLPI